MENGALGLIFTVNIVKTHFALVMIQHLTGINCTYKADYWILNLLNCQASKCVHRIN